MSLRLSGLNPLAYKGVEALQPPDLVVAERDPISGAVQFRDYKNFNIGTFWLNSVNETLWVLVNKEANIPLWIEIGIASGGFIHTITGNTGGPITPIANNITIITDNSTVVFAGTPGTQTLDFGIPNLILGGNPPITTATQNVGLGSSALISLTTGNDNTGIGFDSLTSLTTGSQNSAVGSHSLNFLTTGSFNSILGYGAGSNYIGAESSNIIIGNLGTVAESNTIRIGTQGAGAFQQNRCFMSGVRGVAVAAPQMVIVDGNGQLGSQAIPAPGGGNVIITNLTTADISPFTFNASTQYVTIYGWSGGGGGGSGRRGASTAAGGGTGGSPGRCFSFSAPKSFFAATEAFVVGTGGTGGASQTVDNSDGNNGGLGLQTTFGNIILGNIGTNIGPGGTSGTAPGSAGGGTYFNFDVARQLLSGVQITQSGGNGTNVAGSSAIALGSEVFNMGATAAGGGAGADSVTPRQGGNGANFVTVDASAVILAGGAGGIEGGTINGGAGLNQVTSGGVMTGGTGGGGAGGQSSGGVAGNGGAGGFPGGAGGGGGGSLNGTNSGTGGDGANGMIIVIEYL